MEGLFFVIPAEAGIQTLIQDSTFIFRTNESTISLARTTLIINLAETLFPIPLGMGCG